MERTITIPVGVIVTRSENGDPSWRTVGLVTGDAAGLQPGSRMWTDGATPYIFAGRSDLSLYASEIDSYQLAIDQQVPSVYVVLKPRPDDSEPPVVHLTSAAPDEAESYLEGDECIVQAVPMPKLVLELVSAFVASHRESPAASSGSRR